MPNTASAERRVRNSARKQENNRSVKSELKTLEKKYLETVKAGKKDDSTTVFKGVASALDKAVKKGVVHRSTANRKKSRLALRLAATK